MTKVALLDCDGVLVDFTGTLLHRLNCGLAPVDVPRHGALFHVIRAAGVKYEEAAEEMLVDPLFWADLEWMHGAREGVHRLQDAGWIIYIVSSPWLACAEWEHRRRVLLHERFGLHADQFISCLDKTLIRGDLMVEDRAETLEAWLAVNPGARGYLIDQPWNRHSNLPRVSRLDEIPTEALR